MQEVVVHAIEELGDFKEVAAEQADDGAVGGLAEVAGAVGELAAAGVGEGDVCAG